MSRFLVIVRQVALFGGLTLLTQVGGLVWLAARHFEKRFTLTKWRRLGYHFAVYLGVTIFVVPVLARIGGRVAMPVWATKEKPVAPRTLLYPLTNRHYVKPEVRDVVIDNARKLRAAYPGSVVHYLDAGFPLFDGFAMMPHLSHGKGEAIDLTFCYYRGSRDDRKYCPSPSPLGYWIYEGPKSGESHPYKNRRSPLRWDLPWLQWANRHRKLDRTRTRALLRYLLEDSRTTKVLLEVHLHRRWGIVHHKLRFQQLHAARHDDHLHLWVKGAR